METKIKKQKTIQMRSVAPYSQSWIEDERNLHTGISKKKYYHINNQIRNEHLYSHTWPTEKISKVNKRRSGSPRGPRGTRQIEHLSQQTKLVLNGERRSHRLRKPSPWRVSRKENRAMDPLSGAWQVPKRAPDPTAPHLKYGLFRPNKQMKRPQAQVFTTPRRTSRSESSSLDRSSKEKKHKDECPNKLTTPGTPLVLFRPTDTHRLSMCKPTHIDIKPTRSSRYP